MKIIFENKILIGWGINNDKKALEIFNYLFNDFDLIDL
jgi:hypothetical protein